MVDKYAVMTNRTGELKFKVEIDFDFSKNVQYSSDYYVDYYSDTLSDYNYYYGGYGKPYAVLQGAVNESELPEYARYLSRHRGIDDLMSGFSGVEASAIASVFGLKIHPRPKIRYIQTNSSVVGWSDVWKFYYNHGIHPYYGRRAYELAIEVGVEARSWQSYYSYVPLAEYTVPTGVLLSYDQLNDKIIPSTDGWFGSDHWNLGYANLKGTVEAIITTTWEELAEVLKGDLSYHRWRYGVPKYDITVNWEGQGDFNSEPITGSTNRGIYGSFTTSEYPNNTTTLTYTESNANELPSIGDSIVGHDTATNCKYPSSTEVKYGIVDLTIDGSSITATLDRPWNDLDSDFATSAPFTYYIERQMSRDSHALPGYALERERFYAKQYPHEANSAVGLARTDDSVHDTPNAIHIAPYAYVSCSELNPSPYEQQFVQWSTGLSECESEVRLYTETDGVYTKLSMSEFRKDTPSMASGRSGSIWIDSTGSIRAYAKCVANPYVGDSNADPYSPAGKLQGASAESMSAYMDSNEERNYMSVRGVFTIFDYPHAITLEPDFQYPDGSSVPSSKITEFDFNGVKFNSANNYTATFGGLWYAHNFTSNNIMLEDDPLRLPYVTDNPCTAVIEYNGQPLKETAPDICTTGSLGVSSSGYTYKPYWFAEYCGGDASWDSGPIDNNNCLNLYYSAGSTVNSAADVVLFYANPPDIGSDDPYVNAPYAINVNGDFCRVDPFDGSLTVLVPVIFTNATSLIINPDNTHALISAGSTPSIYKVDLTAYTTVQVLTGVSFTAMSFDLAGTTLYAADSSGGIRKYVYTADPLSYTDSGWFVTYNSAASLNQKLRYITGLCWADDGVYGHNLYVAHKNVPDAGDSDDAYIVCYLADGSFAHQIAGYGSGTGTAYPTSLWLSRHHSRPMVNIKNVPIYESPNGSEIAEIAVGGNMDSFPEPEFAYLTFEILNTNYDLVFEGYSRIYCQLSDGTVDLRARPDAWVYDARLPKNVPVTAVYNGEEHTCMFRDPDVSPYPVLDLKGPSKEVLLSTISKSFTTAAPSQLFDLNPRVSDGSYVSKIRIIVSSNKSNSFSRLLVSPDYESGFSSYYPITLERNELSLTNRHSRTAWSHTGTTLPSWMTASDTWGAEAQMLEVDETLTVSELWGIDRTVQLSVYKDKLYTWYNNILHNDTQALLWPSENFTAKDFVASASCAVRSALSLDSETSGDPSDFDQWYDSNDSDTLNISITVPERLDGTTFTIDLHGQRNDSFMFTHLTGDTSTRYQDWFGRLTLERVDSGVSVKFAGVRSYIGEDSLGLNVPVEETTEESVVIAQPTAVYQIIAGDVDLATPTQLNIYTDDTLQTLIHSLSVTGFDNKIWSAVEFRSDWPEWDSTSQFEVNRIWTEVRETFRDEFGRANGALGNNWFTAEVDLGHEISPGTTTIGTTKPGVTIESQRMRFIKMAGAYDPAFPNDIPFCSTGHNDVSSELNPDRLSALIYTPTYVGNEVLLCTSTRTNDTSPPSMGVSVRLTAANECTITLGHVYELQFSGSEQQVTHVITNPAASYRYQLDHYSGGVCKATVISASDGSTVATLTLDAVDSWYGTSYFNACTVTGIWRNALKTMDSMLLYVDNVVMEKRGVDETFNVAQATPNMTSNTRDTWLCGDVIDGKVVKLYPRLDMWWDLYVSGNWLDTTTQVGDSPTYTPFMQLQPGKMVFMRNGGGLNLGDRNNNWPHYSVYYNSSAPLTLADHVPMDKFSDGSTSKFHWYVDDFMLQDEYFVYSDGTLSDTPSEHVRLYPNQYKYALPYINHVDLDWPARYGLDETATTAIKARKKVKYLSGIVENINYNNHAAFTVKPWAVVGSSVAGISSLNDMPFEANITDGDRSQNVPGIFIHMGLDSDDPATVTATRSFIDLPTEIRTGLGANITVPASADPYRAAYIFKSALDSFGGPQPSNITDSRSTDYLNIGPYDEVLVDSPVMPEDTEQPPEPVYIEESASSPDTMYRKVISGMNYPGAVVYSEINRVCDNLLPTTFRCETDSYIWRAEIPMKPWEETTVIVTTGAGNLVPRRAKTQWDFFNTCDPVWYPGRFLEDDDNPYDEGLPSGDDTYYVYMRNLEVVNLAFTCTSMNQKVKILSNSSDFHVDSPIWYKLPEQVREHIPYNFHWVTIPNHALTVDATGVYALLYDIGDVSVRYRSRSKLTALLSKADGVPTTVVTACGQQTHLQRMHLPNALDSFAELMSIERDISDTVIETNTSLAERVLNAGLIPRSTQKLPLLFAIANQIGTDGSGEHLVKVLDFDIAANSAEQETLDFAASGVSDVAGIYIPGLPEFRFVEEELQPDNTRIKFYATSKIDEESGYNILIDGVVTNKGSLDPDDGCCVVFPSAVNGRVTVRYVARNYSLTVTDGYITAITAIRENAPVGSYKVLALRKLSAGIPSNSEYFTKNLLDMSGAPNTFLLNMVESAKQSSPVAVGYASWGNSSSWFDEGDVSPGISYLPLLLDNAGNDS